MPSSPTNEDWLYVNIWDGHGRWARRMSEYGVRLLADAVGTASDTHYGVLVKADHLIVIQWLDGPSIHVYIHESLIDA